MSELVAETEKRLSNYRAALGSVEQHLKPLLAKQTNEVLKELNGLEAAELHVALAYATGSLYFGSLQAKGMDPKEHPIMKELERIQLYFKKVKSEAETEKARKAWEAQEKLSLDQESAQRLVERYEQAKEAARQRKERGEVGRHAEHDGYDDPEEDEEEPIEHLPPSAQKEKITELVEKSLAYDFAEEDGGGTAAASASSGSQGASLKRSRTDEDDADGGAEGGPLQKTPPGSAARKKKKAKAKPR